ncbi:MAG: hypothetical protein MJY67_01805 [Bacteroidales bacterium]|nr:hypothetical protein [Bacteroidales bacterium]
MKKFYLCYEAPSFDTIEVESLDVLCQSSGGAGNESYTDGNWEWDN